MRISPDGNIAEEAARRADAPAASSARFEDLIPSRWYPLLRRIKARYPALSWPAAEDVASEAISRVYWKWQNEGEMANPVGYLTAVANNLAIDALRAQDRMVLTENLADLPVVAPKADHLADAEAFDLVRASIETMSAGRRQEVMRLQIRGQADAEIAASLGITVNQVHVQRHRAISELRRKLNDHIRQQSRKRR